MRRLLWKKAAITAMAGTMMMMTGCELQGTVNKNQTTSTAATVQTSKTAESSANTQPSSVTPNTTVLPVNKAYLLHFMSTFPIAVVSTAATIASGTPFVAMIVKITP